MEDLIKKYRCGDLEESIFTMKKFAHTGFSADSQTDALAHQVRLSDLIKCLSLGLLFAYASLYSISSFLSAIGTGARQST